MQKNSIIEATDNLCRYNDETDQLSSDDRDSFNNVFIGALTTTVRPSDWQECLQAARDYIIRSKTESLVDSAHAKRDKP